jgi:hypothetical protein
MWLVPRCETDWKFDSSAGDRGPRRPANVGRRPVGFRRRYIVAHFQKQITPDCRGAAILAQNNLKYLIETDPVPNAVIPI